MKIEDIKPGDVIVRTEDKAFFKIVEVTPDRKIMQSANGRMNEVFCIFLEPEILVCFAEDDYEPATEDQRQYVDSKLADFYGTNAEAASKRFMQYNDLRTEHEELRQQYDAAKVELQKSSEKLKESYDDYRALRDDYDTANSCLARFENAEIEHSDFSTMAFDCPHGVEAKVCSAECLGCEHCLTQGNTGTESILCAYSYDKEKEKEQYLDKLRRQMIRNLNS